MWTWLAIICIVLCFILVMLCYIWLYILAERQDARHKRTREARIRIAEMLSAVIDSPTETSQAAEIEALQDYISQNKRHMDILADMIIEGLLHGEEEDDRGRRALYKAYEALKPQEYYSDLLRDGTPYEKAYACQKLAAFYQESEIPNIRRHLFARNKELVYNAAKALAILGDEDGLTTFILSCEKNYSYSHRVILELISLYSGDVKELAGRVMENCNDYIQATVIKAVASYKIQEFEKLYKQCARHKDGNVRAAAIKALCEIGKPDYEQLLITATNDTMWYVRSAAVKGLGKINTPNSRAALIKAVQDKEWWVRYNAARTLVEMDGGLELAEQVLGGYDRFAADAVKYALYKTYDV